MNKIIDYAIASDSDSDKVTLQVKDLIDLGFQPLGGVCSAYAPDEEKFYVFQAMVKYAESAGQQPPSATGFNKS